MIGGLSTGTPKAKIEFVNLTPFNKKLRQAILIDNVEVMVPEPSSGDNMGFEDPPGDDPVAITGWTGGGILAMNSDGKWGKRWGGSGRCPN